MCFFYGVSDNVPVNANEESLQISSNLGSCEQNWTLDLNNDLCIKAIKTQNK